MNEGQASFLHLNVTRAMKRRWILAAQKNNITLEEWVTEQLNRAAKTEA